MPRVMALDIGQKTIGVAISDEAGRIAFPSTTIWRKEGIKRDMAALRELVSANAVRAIVVGLPLMMDNSRGIQVEKVEEFVRTLRNHVRVPIILQDERLSTWEAEQVLIAAGRPRSERKKTVDAMAASLILQDYLDSRGSATAEPQPEDAA